MPQSGTDTLTIGSGVGSFEIPGCGEACLGSVLVLIAPQGKHIQLIDGYGNPYDDGPYYRGDLNAFDGAYDNPIADDASRLYGSASYGETLTIVSAGITDEKTVAHIINGNTSHKASVENRGNKCSGSVSSGNLNLNSVAVGTPVTLTVNPDEGCALSDAYVTVRAPGDTARVPMVGGSWFAGNELSFTMPYVDVYVVVNYVKETEMTAANRVSVVVPRKNSLSVTIPDGVKSFNVVQKKPVNNGVLVLTAPENMKLQISGCTYGESSNEILKIYDGANTSATELLSIRSGSVDVLSSGNTMTLLVNGEYVIGDLTVELVSSNAGNAAVTYIDANGTEQELSPTQYTVLSSNIEPVNGLINLPGGWYVVNGNVAFSNPLLFDGETHIVLADGAEMRVNVWDDYFENSGYWDYGRNSAVVVKNRLAVYGQSLGSGSLIVESAGSGNYEYSVFAYDGIAINGGHVTIDGNITAGRWNDESFVVNGGIVNIHGVYAYDITLDWHKTTDTIVAENFYQPSSGSSTAIAIAEGKAFKDENGKAYRGTYELFSVLSGKTLTPCYAVSVDLQDGSPVTYLAVNIGESFQRPDNPTRAGATFLGWYTSADGDTEFDFSAPITGNTSIYAKWEQEPVKYIDENGEEQSVSKYIVLSTGVSLPSEDDGTPYLPSGWYVVENSNTDLNDNGGIDLLIEGYINAHGDVHVILADGAEMKVTGGFGLYEGNLTVYGQVNGTGALNVSSSIWGYYNLTINGGRVTAENGIRAGIFSINGGYVKADKDTRTGIDCYNFVMNGGSISLGYVSASANITLGWRNTADSITVQYYYSGNSSKNTSIAEGKSFKDESGIVYTGSLSQAQNNAIGGKILTPYVELNCAGVQIFEDQNGRHAVFNGSYGGENETEAVNIPSGITVNSVQFTRDFPVGVYSTMVLPFSVNTAHVGGLKAVLYYNGIRVEDDKSSPNYGKSYIRMKVLWAEDGYIKDKNGKGVSYRHTNMSANTPYMLLMNEPTFTINAAAYPLTLVKTGLAEKTLDGWTFRGTWKYKEWGASGSDPETGFAYGFAASTAGSGNDLINVGDFVKVGAGAWIRPMRAYLVRNDKMAQLARANGAYVKRPSVVQEELPEIMSIVIDSEDGNEEHTTVIGQFNTRTGEFKMNPDATKRTFDVKGRNVGNKANKARGAYYGKKILK